MTESTMTIDHATASTTDHNQVKNILEPFRQIFMTVLENAEIYCVSHFTENLASRPIIITVHPVEGNTFSVLAKGRAAFSPNVPYDMQTAILKFNQCDMSVLCFLDWIRDALRPIGATVDWLLIVSVHPHFILHYSDDEPITKDGRHSVFAITTASREQYIADFTPEQFGYPAGLWFFEKAEYFARYVEVGAGSHIALEEEMDAAERDVTESDIQEHTRYCIDAVCGEIHWPDYHKLSAEERMPWLDARTREIVGRLEAEDHLNSAPDAH